MISVHILVKRDKSSEYSKKLEKCIDSLKNQPVDVNVCDHIDGLVGLARTKAIEQSISEWVSWVDPDDYVIDNGFSACWNMIQDNPDCSAVYTNHWIAENHRLMRTWFSTVAPNIGYSQQHQMHHLVVYKKKYIIPEFEYIKAVKTKYKTLFNFAALYHGKVVGTDTPYYVWNKDGNQNHLRFSTKDNPKEWHSRLSKYIDNMPK